MSKRAKLPGASELFRPTKPAAATPPPVSAPSPVPEDAPAATGRIKHDHKITVYFSEDELNALEDANLSLRRSHGIRVDRGRLVRVAVAHAIADLLERGEAAFLVDELRER